MNGPYPLLEQMASAGIVGRGGAGFPTHLKWKRLKELGRPIGYVVCNASEGEPSVMKDAWLLEHEPQRVLDGMVAAMEFLETTEAYFNINQNYYNEYGKNLEALTQILKTTRGLSFTFFIEKPSYIGGETGALLNAIEGKRTQPRLSPPSPSLTGIHGKPVLLDNVETFYDVARLLDGSFLPTRYATLVGPIPYPGVYCVSREATVKQVLESTNNLPDFEYFVQVGGSASGEVVSQMKSDNYVLNGCGALEVYRLETDPRQVLARWFDFYLKESCGKCTPCREGTVQLHSRLAALDPTDPLPWADFLTILRTMNATSFCDLGKSLLLPVESYMKNVLGLEVSVRIDGKEYQTKPGQTVLQLALDEEIAVPHFCYHEDLAVEANCRTCFVEVLNPGKEGKEKVGEIVPSCTLRVTEGLEVAFQSDPARDARETNVGLLFSRRPPPKLLDLYSYPNGGAGLLGTAALFDSNLCVACNLCVKACSDIGIGYLVLKGKGVDNRVAATEDPAIQCIYCGQCTVHCPVAAVREQSQLEAVETALADPSKKVIVQMAPSVRVTIGEAFGFSPGVNLEKQLYSGFRVLGFDKVFDVNWGADLTTIVETDELLERIREGKVLPMFTSCCPAWVRFVEVYYPEFIPNLTTARSPQIHAGMAYKTWWAEKEGVDPRNVVVVSIMPCTSKKHEAGLEKLKIDGMKPVDYVLTTRETAALFRKNGVDLKNLLPSEADTLGEHSGAAAIYGASGGVMEAALRTAAFRLLGRDLEKIEFEQVRGLEGIKKATVKLGSRELRVAVVTTPKNARLVLEQIKSDVQAYDYVEFMACPGGCLGGGGNPIPTTKRIIQKRMKSLYEIDAGKVNRRAHRNPLAQEYLDYCAKQGSERAHQLLHTTYSGTQSAC